MAFIAASFSIWASLATKGSANLFWIGVALPCSLAAFRAVQCSSSVLHNIKAITLHVNIEAEIIANDFLMVPVLWCAAPVNGILCAVIHRLVWAKSPE